MASTQETIPTDVSANLRTIEGWENSGRQWSEIGERLDVDYVSLSGRSQAELRKQEVLGKGAFATVFRVVYRSVPLARKSLRFETEISQDLLRALRAQIVALKKVEGHHHIIKVVGSYWKEDYSLNILIFPVAVCSLGQFLDDYEKIHGFAAFDDDSRIRNRFAALGFGDSLIYDGRAATEWVTEIMGCITRAIMWMHEKGVCHQSISPPNILLGRSQVYLSGFGLAREDHEDLDTELVSGYVRGYTAPEVLNFETFNPRQADVYATGCVFLYILTVKYGPIPTQTGSEADFQVSRHQERQREFQRYLSDREHSNGDHPFIPRHLIPILAAMLASDRKSRPSIQEVDQALQTLSGRFYGPCCSGHQLGLQALSPRLLARTPTLEAQPSATVSEGQATSSDDYNQSQGNLRLGTARLRRRELFQKWEVEGRHWSGTGKQYEVKWNEIQPNLRPDLQNGKRIGRGGFGTVYEISFCGVLLAKKVIFVDRENRERHRKEVETEATLSRKLDAHHHMVILVGTFWDADMEHLNILTYPVAICDLSRFLDDCDKFGGTERSSLSSEAVQSIMTRFDDMGFTPTPNIPHDVTPRLLEIMGCATKALKWMHSQNVAHRDFKPANILLQRTGIYITDFGIARDKSTPTGSTTHTPPWMSREYAPPEVRNFGQYEAEEYNSYNARQSDIFYLGCVLLHILSVVYAPTPVPVSDNLRNTNRREDFCAYLAKPYHPHPYLPMDLVNFLKPMFAEHRKNRPEIEAVDRSLQELGGPDRTYYGRCCHQYYDSDLISKFGGLELKESDPAVRSPADR